MTNEPAILMHSSEWPSAAMAARLEILFWRIQTVCVVFNVSGVYYYKDAIVTSEFRWHVFMYII